VYKGGTTTMSTTKDKSGYLYVLAHPDLPGYYKLGQTTKHPTKRLKIHNTSFERILGKLAQLTGKPWQLIYYVPVTDPRRAESAFLWYDVLPRWDNLEINKGDISGVIEEIKTSSYLDQVRYNEMINSELRGHDIETLLIQLKGSWSRDGVVEACEVMIKNVKEERRSRDKRRRQYPDGSWSDDFFK
jgi:hypothetical protein